MYSYVGNTILNQVQYNTCKLYFSVNEIMLWFLFEIHVRCSLKQFNSNSLIVPAQSTLGFCLISCPFEFPGLAGQFFKLSNVQGPLLNCRIFESTCMNTL